MLWKSRRQMRFWRHSEYSNNNRKIVIFDDLLNCPEKIQKKISSHFTDGRHHGISPIYLSQSYHSTPQQVRQTCTHMILFEPNDEVHKSLIARENNIDKKLFDKLKKHEFLFVDKNKKTCKKNFDETI